MNIICFFYDFKVMNAKRFTGSGFIYVHSSCTIFLFFFYFTLITDFVFVWLCFFTSCLIRYLWCLLILVKKLNTKTIKFLRWLSHSANNQFIFVSSLYINHSCAAGFYCRFNDICLLLFRCLEQLDIRDLKLNLLHRGGKRKVIKFCIFILRTVCSRSGLRSGRETHPSPGIKSAANPNQEDSQV